MQKHAAESLVRNAATLYANQSPLFEDPARTDSYAHLQLPSQTQKEALNQLRFFDKDKIFAWIAILRCIEPGFRYCPRGGGCLSSQQLDALAILKDCDDAEILAWSNLHLFASDVNGQHTSISTFGSLNLPRPRHHRRPSTNPSLRSSASSLAPSTVFGAESSHSTPRSSLDHSFSLPELPEEVTSTGEPAHAHWCTYGEHPKPIYTCEGWKRHEREHEVHYPCMPNGPVEDTEHGPRCVLCHKENPDEEHLSRHNVSVCTSKFGGRLTKSRRMDMIIHLKKHRVHSKDAAALADKWRYSSNKKNFSCGLCVKFFSSIAERSNHIDNEHWSQGQNMDAWELTNCIRGLLLERKVQAAWRSLLRCYPTKVECNLRWEMPLAEGLQLRLEKGEEPPEVLAMAALQLSSCEQPRPGQEGAKVPTGREVISFGPIAAALPDPTYQPLPDHTQPPAYMTSRLPRSPSSRNAASCSSGFPEPDPGSSLISSAASEDSLQHGGVFGNAQLPTVSLLGLNNGETLSQSSTHAWSTEWLPMYASQPLDDNTRIKCHLSETGALLMAQMTSPRHGQSATHAGFSEQGPMWHSPADVNTANAPRIPISAYSRRLPAQLPNHEYGFDLRNKPLPPKPPLNLPGDANKAFERRQTTPMDLTTG